MQLARDLRAARRRRPLQPRHLFLRHVQKLRRSRESIPRPRPSPAQNPTDKLPKFLNDRLRRSKPRPKKIMHASAPPRRVARRRWTTTTTRSRRRSSRAPSSSCSSCTSSRSAASTPSTASRRIAAATEPRAAGAGERSRRSDATPARRHGRCQRRERARSRGRGAAAAPLAPQCRRRPLRRSLPRQSRRQPDEDRASPRRERRRTCSAPTAQGNARPCRSGQILNDSREKPAEDGRRRSKTATNRREKSAATPRRKPTRAKTYTVQEGRHRYLDRAKARRVSRTNC